jgi:hypothetical protein
MKDLVISVVSFFVWLMLVISTFVGFILGSPTGHQILGAIAGFALGCFGAGFWFLLTSINEKLATLADIAVKNRADLKSEITKEKKVEPESDVVDGVSKWTGEPVRKPHTSE